MEEDAVDEPAAAVATEGDTAPGEEAPAPENPASTAEADPYSSAACEFTYLINLCRQDLFYGGLQNFSSQQEFC